MRRILPLIILLLPFTAPAHDAGQARLTFDMAGSGRVEMAAIDALDLLGLPEGALAGQPLFDAIVPAFPDWLSVESAAGSCPVKADEVEQLGIKGVGIDYVVTCDGDPTLLDWKASRHPRLKLAAVGTVRMGDGSDVAISLGRANPTVALGGTDGPSSFAGFLLSGVEHIVIGWDHLAFLLALILGCSNLRRLLAIVTAFTVAHSITLALGATGTVELPAEPVEAVIAFSIAIAAGVGLWRWRKGMLDHPGRETPTSGGLGPLLAICFAFGLVHGLGFAGLLAEMLPAGGGRLVPLVAFNVGVELGQVAIVALIFPILSAAGRRPGGPRAFAALLGGLALLGTIIGVVRIA